MMDDFDTLDSLFQDAPETEPEEQEPAEVPSYEIPPSVPDMEDLQDLQKKYEMLLATAKRHKTQAKAAQAAFNAHAELHQAKLLRSDFIIAHDLAAQGVAEEDAERLARVMSAWIVPDLEPQDIVPGMGDINFYYLCQENYDHIYPVMLETIKEKELTIPSGLTEEDAAAEFCAYRLMWEDFRERPLTEEDPSEINLKYDSIKAIFEADHWSDYKKPVPGIVQPGKLKLITDKGTQGLLYRKTAARIADPLNKKRKSSDGIFELYGTGEYKDLSMLAMWDPSAPEELRSRTTLNAAESVVMQSVYAIMTESIPGNELEIIEKRGIHAPWGTPVTMTDADILTQATHKESSADLKPDSKLLLETRKAMTNLSYLRILIDRSDTLTEAQRKEKVRVMMERFIDVDMGVDISTRTGKATNAVYTVRRVPYLARFAIAMNHRRSADEQALAQIKAPNSRGAWVAAKIDSYEKINILNEMVSQFLTYKKEAPSKRASTQKGNNFNVFEFDTILKACCVEKLEDLTAKERRTRCEWMTTILESWKHDKIIATLKAKKVKTAGSKKPTTVGYIVTIPEDIREKKKNTSKTPDKR